MNQRKKRFTHYLLPALILIMSVVIVKYLYDSKPKAKQKVIEETAWVVDAQRIQSGSFQPIIQLYGQIHSNAQVDITAAVEAQVSKRYINEGDKVTQNQKLVDLDQTRIELQIAQHQAELREIQSQIDDELHRHQTDQELLINERRLLEIAKNAVSRSKTLEKSEMASSSQLDDALKSEIAQQIAISQREAMIRNHPTRLAQLKARLQQSKTRLALSQDDLNNTKIVSPINGVISKLFVDESEHVRKGSDILRLLDQENIEIRSLLPEKQVTQIQDFLSAQHKLFGQVVIAKRTYKIQLDRLAGNVDKGLAGTFAYFKFVTVPKQLLIGQTVELRLDLPAVNNSITLPHEALYGTESVFKIENQRLRRVAINWLGETALASGDMAILVSSPGLNTGDTVLTSKFANAMQGLKVKIRNQDQ